MVPGPATFPVQVNGEAQVGKTLTADSSNLSERYGVQVTSMTYQWLANGARVPGANAQTYKPDDGKQGKKISVMATYTDDGGNEDTVTSGPTEPLAARDRIRRATGLPLISGRALVGHTLTADTSLIIDANGLENAVFYYFWEADDDSIPEATGTTYTPVAADVGKVITFIVAYVDDSGRGQSMTSQPTMPVMTEEAAAAAEFRTSLRAAANADGSVTLYWNAPDDEVTGYRILRHRHSLGELDPLVYVADTGSTATTFTDTGVVAGVPHSYRVQAIRNAALGERTRQIRIFPVQKASNSPATGAPAISGTARVGETLTADISGIADADGLENVTKNYLWAAIDSSGKIGAKWAYQWLADGAASASGDHHAGYNNTTYTLAEDDAGKAISVRVTFVDDAGYQETLTSAATNPVAPLPQPNSPATGAPAISGTAQVGETLTVDTSGITDADGLDDSTFTHQWVREDSVVVGAAARTYTPTDGDRGKAVKVRVSFTDDAGNWETRTSAQTAAVAARANSAGICDRTEQVRDNIIGLLNAQDLGSLGIEDCSEVTDEQLTRIRFLDLAGGGIGGKITSLKSGDFEGLSGMSELNLEDNSLSEAARGRVRRALQPGNAHDARKRPGITARGGVRRPDQPAHPGAVRQRPCGIAGWGIRWVDQVDQAGHFRQQADVAAGWRVQWYVEAAIGELFGQPERAVHFDGRTGKAGRRRGCGQGCGGRAVRHDRHAVGGGRNALGHDSCDWRRRHRKRSCHGHAKKAPGR